MFQENSPLFAAGRYVDLKSRSEELYLPLNFFKQHLCFSLLFSPIAVMILANGFQRFNQTLVRLEDPLNHH